jgi:hypothetical protein
MHPVNQQLFQIFHRQIYVKYYHVVHPSSNFSGTLVIITVQEKE